MLPVELQKRQPHLRVVLTPYCNYKCVYCRPGGEGYGENLSESLSGDEFVDLVSLCGDIGFKHIKFTGGEPLLRKDTPSIIKRIRELGKFKHLDIVTNGSFLYQKANELKDAGLDAITVSLDAADKDAFAKISKVDDYEKVILGLKEAGRIGLKTRINSVLMQSNKNQLEGLVRVAEETGAELKIIDAMNVLMEDDKWSAYSWNDEFLHLGYVVDALKLRTKDVTYSYPPGGLGTPMITLHLDSGAKVLLRDATVGTNYDKKTCGVCKYYPCHDALISLRLTHDGHLKKCLIRNDNLLDVITPLRNGNREEAKERIKFCYDILMRAEYQPNAWKPENDKKYLSSKV
jgi:cyclic pyranopterin phosphate synthase